MFYPSRSGPCTPRAGRLLGEGDLIYSNAKVYCKKDDHMFVRCNPYLNLWVDELDPRFWRIHLPDPSYVTTRPRCEMASIDEVYLDLTEEAG